MRARKLLARLAVLVGAVVVSFGLCELLVRALLPAPEVYGPNRVKVEYQGEWRLLPVEAWSVLLTTNPDPELADLRGEHRPGVRFKMCFDAHGKGRRPYFDEDGCVLCEINAAGLRGPLRSKEKPAGTYRVAVVGDSFTFGHGVPYESTWGAALEGGLQNALATGRAGGAGATIDRAEVLNFGVNGYGIRDVALTVRHKALTWSPDRVQYGFYLNDLLFDQEGLEAPEDEIWRGVNEMDLQEEILGEPRGFSRYSRLWMMALRALAKQRADSNTTEVYLWAATPGSPRFEAWKVHLADMAEACSAAGVPLDVVIFPDLVDLDDTHPFLPAYDAVRAAAEELGLGVVEVFEAWKGEVGSKLWVHPTDHHPGDLAHASAGLAVCEHLLAADPKLR